MNYTRKTKEDVVLFVCDIQEKLRGKIPNYDDLIFTSSLILQIAQQANIPYHIVVVTPQRNGPLVKEISEKLTQEQYDSFVHQKNSPTMLDERGKQFLQQNSTRKTVILCGIETHVCIQQTAQDLIKNGYDVLIMLDSVNSQRKHDYEAAIYNLKKYGCYFYTIESLFMEIFGQKLDFDSVMKQKELYNLEHQNRQYFKNKKKIEQQQQQQQLQQQIVLEKPKL